MKTTKYEAIRGTMSTAALPEKDRLNTWRELFGRQFLRLDVDPLDDEPFRFDVDYVALPGLSLSSGSISAVRCTRTAQLARDQNDDLILLIPQSGKMEVRERGKEEMVGSGDALIRRSCEVGQTFSTSGQYLTLSIPHSAVIPHVGDIERLGFAVLPHQNKTLALLHNYLAMLLNNNIITDTRDSVEQYMAEMIARHVHEMTGLLLGTTRDLWEISSEPGGGLFATRLAAIHAQISHNATNPDFSIHNVAHSLDISPGYLRKLLATQGVRFSDLLRSARLDIAHRMLNTPHNRRTEIAHIALNCGFNDISYFNRCFKQRFGMTPGDVRRGEDPA